MNQPCNVLLITDYNAPYGGNLLCSFIALERKMNQDGNQLYYLFPKRAEGREWIRDLIKMDENRVRVLFFEESPLKIAKSIQKCVAEYQISIVYAHLCKHKSQIGIAAARHIFARNAKLVQHYHNHAKIPANLFKRIFNITGYKVLFNGDLAIGCSQDVADGIPLPQYKRKGIENAIDFTRLDEYEHGYEIIKNKKDQKIVLLFGFDYYRKGVDIALDAFSDIAEKKNLVLALCLAVGKEEISKKIIEKFGKIPDWIVFLPPRNDVATYYHSADIFLSAAREEGFCYSIVESIYCGDICISSRIGGCPLQIPGLYTFETENAADLKRVMLEILEASPEEIRKRKSDSREYSVQNYHVNKWAQTVAETLYQL